MVALNSTDASEFYLVLTDHTDFCHMYPLRKRKPLSIGRDGSNRVVLLDKRTSREHCVIRWLQGDWYVFDLNSSNGTQVNGVRIRHASRLEPGDVLTVGRTHLQMTSRLQLTEGELSPVSSESPERPGVGFGGTTVIPPQ